MAIETKIFRVTEKSLKAINSFFKNKTIISQEFVINENKKIFLLVKGVEKING